MSEKDIEKDALDLYWQAVNQLKSDNAATRVDLLHATQELPYDR